ncbi:hypothetical protein [Gordonibacter massiliensis (ex Traore et al. 2017)]|uniref:hypothetical protein n=1 Tax=Gordonibacter massiliensis (ex Traore et al. 2017) TaxID=1841863 RepID=UPI001C8B3196|nr:hypothetical protein [Gordonibacter massiliensis (ex Traore et al. 2017)]MBX9035035.1 hypothetical protein [Gordonibacter massiliensis (ex Traore et al. 2017)]
MIRGETVEVLEVSKTGVDGFNKAVREEVPVPVDDVLVAPCPAVSASEANRPDGAVAACTLYFPKTYQSDLYGKSVVVRGKSFKVIGNPQRYGDENVPGRWNLVVEVETVDG